MNCTLCGSSVHQLIFQQPGGETRVMACKACGHIFSDTPSLADSMVLHSDPQYKVVDNRRGLFNQILDWEYGAVVNKLSHYCHGPGSLLDFGCGKGKFAAIAKSKGWRASGVETNSARAAYAREVYSLEVNSENYTTGQIFPDRFSAITFFHVLEHLAQPSVLLTALLGSNLVKGGVVVIEVPNFNSWQRKLAGRHWHHLDFPRHINHFTLQSLLKLAEESGLAMIRKSYFSFHLGVLGMADSLMKLFGYRKNIIYELKYRRTTSLILKLVIALPFALVLEGLASIFRQGGVLRIYFHSKKCESA
jgi:SAM-dependent methyltransferase